MPRRAASPRRIALATAVLAVCFQSLGRGQQSPTNAAPTLPAPEPFGIIDNSFLVEESFNQDPGTFQNIFGFVRSNGSWAATFIQEWPLVSDTHQLSYALSWTFGSGERAFGDTLLNYRFQALREGPGRPALAPRISAILPTASHSAGDDAWGVQINLPFSKRIGDIYWHWNAGLTWLPSAGVGSDSDSLESPFLAGSAIYRLASMFHLMLEVVANFDEQLEIAGTARTRSLTASPGVRGGWNIGNQQVVFGLAVPTTWSSDASREVAALLYASYELPFKK